VLKFWPDSVVSCLWCIVPTLCLHLPKHGQNTFFWFIFFALTRLSVRMLYLAYSLLLSSSNTRANLIEENSSISSLGSHSFNFGLYFWYLM
jgi:hypothetical protein